jgi:hypothetical protein
MPGWCRHRVLVNGEAGDPRSRAGRRAVGLPVPLVQLAAEHKEQQGRDREHARQLWRESGYAFTSPTGQPLNPNSDHHRWKALLKSAGVRDARLHDARHTAATVLLVLGVPERTVMGIMGWSSTSMAARYQHGPGPACCGGPGWRPVVGRSGGRPRCQLSLELRLRRYSESIDPGTAAHCAWSERGGCGIRTREGVNPTRFPTLHRLVRSRPSVSIPA